MACSDPTGPTLSDQNQLVLQIVAGLNSLVLPHDAATITFARVNGSTLQLTVQYGGGCGTHRFALVTGTDLGESVPPYAQLRLVHDGGGDLCEALLTRELVVDLSPIIPLVQRNGGTALRFDLIEPGQQVSAVGELLLTF